MRAILIKRDGFRKVIDVRQRVPVISIAGGMHDASVMSLEDVRIEDLKLDIIEYRFVREYDDEFENHVLIYKETP